MPYIEKDKRNKFDELIQKLLNETKNNGELNYIITYLIHGYLPDKVTMRYDYLNEVVGVLECAKMALFETVITPYEKEKMKQNGAISDLDEGYLIQEK